MPIKGKHEHVRDLVKEIRDLVKRLDVVFNTVITGTGLAQETTLSQIETNTDNVEGILSQIQTNTATTANYTTDSGAVDVNTLRVVLEDVTRNTINYANWDTIPGNRVEYSWINGTIPGNRLVQTIRYYTGATNIFNQTLSYNATDEIISIVAS